MNKFNYKKERGFTLIEMMVSVSIFAIVLIVAMGAILTIVDANRKSRTLTSVMNNISFSFDSITRTIKSGTDPITFDGGKSISVCSINLNSNNPDNFERVKVVYKHNFDDKSIERCVTASGCSGACSVFSPITAPEVDVNNLNFEIIAGGQIVNSVEPGEHPRVLITIDGEANLNKIKSEFSMQTTVDQRRLNLPPPPAPITP